MRALRAGAAAAGARAHGRDRRRHRPEPAALPRRPRRTGPGRTRRGDAARLRRRCVATGGRRALVDAPAERLPFADGSVDTVVSTLVLCTVDAPDSRAAGDRAGAAARRSAALHRARPLRVAAARPLAGPPRRAVAALRRGLSLQPRRRRADRGVRIRARHVREASWRGMPPIVRPLVAGRARHAARPRQREHALARAGAAADGVGLRLDVERS